MQNYQHFCVNQVFEGNTDSYSVKHSYLDEPVVARFIKFHTVHWNKHPSMRVEIIGCQGVYSIGPLKLKLRQHES